MSNDIYRGVATEHMKPEQPNANERQVGGDHYKGKPFEHWDVVIEHDLDYFQGQVTKYLMRWKKKNGLEDLMKARHYLDKYIEAVEAGKVEDPVQTAMMRGDEIK